MTLEEMELRWGPAIAAAVQQEVEKANKPPAPETALNDNVSWPFEKEGA